MYASPNPIHFIYFVCLCFCVCTHACVHAWHVTCGGQRATQGSKFSPSTVWVHWGLSLGHHLGGKHRCVLGNLAGPHFKNISYRALFNYWKDANTVFEETNLHLVVGAAGYPPEKLSLPLSYTSSAWYSGIAPPLSFFSLPLPTS